MTTEIPRKLGEVPSTLQVINQLPMYNQNDPKTLVQLELDPGLVVLDAKLALVSRISAVQESAIILFGVDRSHRAGVTKCMKVPEGTTLDCFGAELKAA